MVQQDSPQDEQQHLPLYGEATVFAGSSVIDDVQLLVSCSSSVALDETHWKPREVYCKNNLFEVPVTAGSCLDQLMVSWCRALCVTQHDSS